MEEAGVLISNIHLRVVARTLLGDYTVSTVFLVFDHAFEGPPLLFETMVIHKEKGFMDEFMWRYHTWDEALAGHKTVVEMVIHGLMELDKEKEPPKTYKIYLMQENAIRHIRVDGGKDGKGD